MTYSEEDDISVWTSNYGNYLGEISQATRDIVLEAGPLIQILPRKGWLLNASSEVRAIFKEKWSIQSFIKFSKQCKEPSLPESASSSISGGQRAGKTSLNTSEVVDAADAPRIARYPPNMGPPPGYYDKAVWDQYWTDTFGADSLNQEIAAHRLKSAEAFSSDSEKNTTQKGKDWRPAVLAQAKSNRQHVRDTLVGPLKTAIQGWEKEGNEDIEDMKQILWRRRAKI